MFWTLFFVLFCLVLSCGITNWSSWSGELYCCVFCLVWSKVKGQMRKCIHSLNHDVAEAHVTCCCLKTNKLALSAAETLYFGRKLSKPTRKQLHKCGSYPGNKTHSAFWIESFLVSVWNSFGQMWFWKMWNVTACKTWHGRRLGECTNPSITEPNKGIKTVRWLVALYFAFVFMSFDSFTPKMI